MGDTKNRNRFDIVADILDVAQKPRKPTHIMYASNLSWKLFQALLSDLIENGTLKRNGDGTYQTTPRGISFLIHYRNMKNTLRV